MDAITLEVMRNRFFAITEEMGAALIRTAYSTNIKDRRDCSCALFDVNGETIAQAEHRSFRCFLYFYLYEKK